MNSNPNLFIFLCLCSLQLTSQVSVGLVAGFGNSVFNKVAGTSSLQFNNLNTHSAGAIIGFQINPSLAIQSEFKYAQMGTRIEDNSGGSGQPDFSTLTMNYFTINLGFSYQFGKENIQGFVIFGPKLGMGVGKIELVNHGGKYLLDYDDLPYEKVDYGIEYGAGVKWILRKTQLFLDLRHYLGMNKLNTEMQYIYPFVNAIIQNQFVGLNMGILFLID